MRHFWCQGQTEAFAGIHQWVEEHGPLKPRNDVQCRPRIVSTPEKDHRRQQHIEYQTNLLRFDQRRHHHAKGSKQPTAQDRNQHKLNQVDKSETQMDPHQQPRERQDHEARNHRLQDADQNLFDRDT